MTALLWRVLIAVICVVLIYAVIPPFSRIIGFPIDGDVMLILLIAVAGIAILYVLKGNPFPPTAS